MLAELDDHIAHAFGRRVPSERCTNAWIDGDGMNRTILLVFHGAVFLHLENV